ncbi:MAG: hypothetical protein WEA56_15365, partial [Balneolaceae bacterium]
MNKYYLIFLIWLLPVYFLLQGGYQVATYYALQHTYEEGDSYVATVTDFEIKQIAAQTNGYIVLRFTPADGEVVERQLALPVQMAHVVMDSEMIPIRYNAGSANPIVIISTYGLQQDVIKVNLGVMAIGLVVTLLISLFATRFALRRIRYGEETLEIERIDD